ncbi:MAG: U32 family peptidase [Bryobacterales bacterium]|nr:U32 family peptidase [Bryobacterales bacterium]
MPRKPEIMSPAGEWPQLHAAVEAGADAVYFGLKHFSARAKVGFGLRDVPEVMRFLRERGVRGYVTFNTLVFEHELDGAAQAIAALAEAGVDALILQDPGAVLLARRIAPGLELHASTQMSITDAGGVRLAVRQGIQRVTLARELSLPQIGAIARETGCDLEIFVHGALCVAYSGQCFSSEAWGGRSANRGQCAQACRLSYSLLVDGDEQPLGDARYLLSPGDLYTLRQVPEILETGVAALKIEGRYKDAAYVALTTHAYRKAVDEAWAGREWDIDPGTELRLEQVYSRGMGPYFLSGTNHQAVVRGRAPRHRGVLMGAVVRAVNGHVIVNPAAAHELAPLRAGDGVVFDAASWRSPDEPEEGGRIHEAKPGRQGTVVLRFGPGDLRSERIRPGDLVWRTAAPEIDRHVRQWTHASIPVARQPLTVHVTARPGEPFSAEWRLLRSPHVTVAVSTGPALTPARNHGISEATLREQLGRLGGTAYELAGLTTEIEGEVFVPLSVLNQARRTAVERLLAAQSQPPGTRVTSVADALERPAPQPAADGPPQLHLLVRTQDQLDAALSLAPDSITLDYLDLYGLRPSVDRVKAAGIAVRVASPRVLKPDEDRIVEFLLRLDCPLLVRSAGMLEVLGGRDHPPLTGDFSLNAANSLTAALYRELGLERLTPSHDLNADQIEEFARLAGADRIEAIAYQHLPVFHTEHCVFCRFLSSGTSFKDCGRPCEKHQVALRDRNGLAHPVIADVGCRNTVFGAEAQEASRFLDTWRRAGIRHFRLEFAHETASQVEKVTRAFAAALAGTLAAQALASALKQAAPEGTTRGSLYVPADYRLLPILQ